MASPQVENGHLTIATELLKELLNKPFTANQMRILFALMSLTYGIGQTKAQVSVYDIQVLTGLQKNRVEQALAGLLNSQVVFKQKLANGTSLMGIVKDYERWEITHLGDKLLRELNDPFMPVDVSYTITSNTTDINETFKTPVDYLLHQVQDKLKLKFSLQAYRIERSKAIKLYELALKATQSQTEALGRILDFLDECSTDAFMSKVRYPFSYMLTGFDQWQRAIPKKPKTVKTDERLTGLRYRYDFKARDWRIARAK